MSGVRNTQYTSLQGICINNFEKVVFILMAISIMALLGSVYIHFSKLNDFEQRMVTQIVKDNEVGKVYKLSQFMSSASYNWLGTVDYIDIKDGFDIESDDGFEKFVFFRNGRRVKVIDTELIGMGDLKKDQIFLDLTSNSAGAYRCTPESRIEVSVIDNDSSFYFIKPLNCLKIK